MQLCELLIAKTYWTVQQVHSPRPQAITEEACMKSSFFFAPNPIVAYIYKRAQILKLLIIKSCLLSSAFLHLFTFYRSFSARPNCTRQTELKNCSAISALTDSIEDRWLDQAALSLTQLFQQFFHISLWSACWKLTFDMVTQQTADEAVTSWDWQYEAVAALVLLIK